MFDARLRRSGACQVSGAGARLAVFIDGSADNGFADLARRIDFDERAGTCGRVWAD
jgi:hypothetical protein